MLRNESNDFRRRSTTREYLQARILQALQDYGAFANWAILGGTALRFLFDLPRYSEDLDFSITIPHKSTRLNELVRRIQSDLQRETYRVEVTMRSQTVVESAFVKFRGLLHELNISPNRDEVLAVKIELDTNPPAGANMETRIIRRFVMLNLQHYDRASLFAGKLHAILTRKYTKGRDLYDLSWYLADSSWPAPNFILLNNALQQTGWDGPLLTRENWRKTIRKKLLNVDWDTAVQDVSPFLDRKQDVAFVSKESLFSLLEVG
jgi:predicted nucleotidyltransferase component of viral defense system